MNYKRLADFTEKQFDVSYSKILKGVAATFSVSKTPYAIILGGQPGAGKTTLQIAARQADKNIIVINGDEYRRYHPNFGALNQVFGRDSVLHTQSFANAVVERLIADLSDRKYNILIEGTLRTADAPLGTCRRLKAKGYSVELSIMAVDKKTSWQGTVERYNAMKAEGITPRATPKESHDLVVSVLPDNLSQIYQSGVFDRITLYNRSRECLYDSQKTPGLNPAPIISAVLEGLPLPKDNAHKVTAKPTADKKIGKKPILARLEANKEIVKANDKTKMDASDLAAKPRKNDSQDRE